MIAKFFLSFPIALDIGLLVMRVGLGLLMAIAHGWGKLTGGPEVWTRLGGAMESFGVPETLYLPFGFMAMVAEFFGGILLALGLTSRVCAFLLLNTMIVATVMKATSGADFQMETSRPLELAVLFLGLLIAGPGRLSIDYLIFGKKKNTPLD